jgi:mannose-6-phosphate isomerase
MARFSLACARQMGQSERGGIVVKAGLDIYPLSFEPILKERVWGGRLLESRLGKRLPDPERPYGESWELVDLPSDQSRVLGGKLAGATLGHLARDLGSRLLGAAVLDGGSFPLLVKFIHAARTLSVQVHPDEEAARRLGGGARPKREAWYILEAEEGARLYLGLETGVSRRELERALRAEGGAGVEGLLRSLPARPGDLVPVRPGTVHAIGAGILLAEVQQPSDTTYRLYDWGRAGLDGRPRALHVEESLASIRFDGAPAGPVAEGDPAEVGPIRLEPLRLGPGASREIAAEGPVVLVGLEGSAEVATTHRGEGGGAAAVGRGGVLLLPAALGGARLRAEDGASLLVATV